MFMYGNWNPIGYSDPYGNPYNEPVRPKSYRITRQQILESLRRMYCPSDLVVVEFETDRARHICPGTHHIKILNKDVANVRVPIDYGMIDVVPVEVIFCPNCKKLIVNRYSLEVL